MSSRNSPSRGARSRSSRYPKLRPGPGRSAEDVAAHQRRRLRVATVELVAANGYNAVAVAALAKQARVSKRDFYKHFSGKEECFLAAYDIIVSHSLRAVSVAIKGDEDWRERLRLAFLAFAGEVGDNPDEARLALIEVFAAGAVAIERMLRTNRLFEVLVAENIAPGADPRRLPPLVVKGIVAGCGRLARARLLSGDSRQLRLDGDELMDWALSFCDHDVARLRGVGVIEEQPLPAAIDAGALGDERAMILAATARLAGREGYATLTVPRIRAAAGISRRSFDSHFEGVADCFLATLETLGNRTLVSAEPSYLTAEDWASGVHCMIVRLCRHLAGDPTFLNLAFLEVFSPGPEALRWRSEMICKLAAMLRKGAPPEMRPTGFAAEASVGAMWGVIHHFAATGRGAQLPAAAAVLSFLALAPAIGGAAAADLIARGGERREGEGSRQIGTSWPERLLRAGQG